MKLLPQVAFPALQCVWQSIEDTASEIISYLLTANLYYPFGFLTQGHQSIDSLQEVVPNRPSTGPSDPPAFPPGAEKPAEFNTLLCGQHMAGTSTHTLTL